MATDTQKDALRWVVILIGWAAIGFVLRLPDWIILCAPLVYLGYITSKTEREKKKTGAKNP